MSADHGGERMTRPAAVALGTVLVVAFAAIATVVMLGSNAADAGTVSVSATAQATTAGATNGSATVADKPATVPTAATTGAPVTFAAVSNDPTPAHGREPRHSKGSEHDGE